MRANFYELYQAINGSYALSESAHTRILRACYTVLVPIARTLLRAGINYREFDELARLAFVRVAGEEYGLRGRPTNVSRIAAMTGLARKEVSRIRELRQVLERQPRTELSPLGDVLHYWHTDPGFTDDRGLPLPLQFDGENPSFTQLVRRCAGDLPAGAVKVELLRIGAVSQDSEGRLFASKRAAVPESVDDRLITSLSFNLFCLASTIAYNSNPDRKGKGRIERFVQSEGIAPAARERIRLIARRRIERFTEDLDDVFSTAERADVPGAPRVGVGVYYYEDDDA